PVTADRVSELTAAANQAAEFADLVELRLDYLRNDELENFKAILPSLIAESSRPLILTLRPVEQGGRSRLDLSRRVGFWFPILKTGNCYFDLEFEVVEQLLAREARVDWSRVICSHHDFNGVPADVREICERLSATRAGLVKIAVAAKDAVDCLTVFHLLDRGCSERRPMIALVMREPGQMTR